MCTNYTAQLTEQYKHRKYAWKVVRVYQTFGIPCIESVFTMYRYQLGDTIHAEDQKFLQSMPKEHEAITFGVFHCYANKKDAEHFREGKNEFVVRVEIIDYWGAGYSDTSPTILARSIRIPNTRRIQRILNR